MAMPRGLAFGSVSGMVGMPVVSENRTVTGVEALRTCGARVREAARGDGVNLPASRIPLACAGRKLGCAPWRSRNAWSTSSAIFWSGRVLVGLMQQLSRIERPKTSQDRGLLD